MGYRSCFKIAWREHSKKHTSLGNAAKRPQTLPTEIDNELESNLTEIPLSNGDDYMASKAYIEGQEINSVIIRDSIENWETIFYDRVYTPTADDVGRCLSIECNVINESGETLAKPVIIFTEPVLARPSLTTKRALVPLNVGNINTNGGLRLRVLSYNILAEVYATRQVIPDIQTYESSHHTSTLTATHRSF